MLNNMSSRLNTISIIIILIFIGYLDYKAGFEISLFPLYVIPIFIVAWTRGLVSTLLISSFSGLIIIISHFETKHFGSELYRYWDGSIKFILVIVLGYSFWKIKQSILIQNKTNHELAEALSRIEVLNNSLNERAVELEFVNKELEAFNYTAAHDLRQPLNLLAIYCQTIDKLFGDQLPEGCKEYVRDAYNTTLRMNSLIEALLNFSRMGQVVPRREMVDLSMLAREVALSRQLAEPERQVDFRIAVGMEAIGDMNLLRVVLDDLLGNAWKYTGMQKKAVIEFGIRDINGVPTYFVRDNGPGFDQVDADKLFVPFQRLKGTEGFKGFGIGLATIERIVQRHGGKIWAEGEPGVGATFYFTLPEDKHSPKLG